MLSTNLEMSQQKASKTEAELERTKVSLREAREEVQKAARESADAVSKSQHNNLLEEVCIYVLWRSFNIRNSARILFGKVNFCVCLSARYLDLKSRSRRCVFRVREKMIVVIINRYLVGMRFFRGEECVRCLVELDQLGMGSVGLMNEAVFNIPCALCVTNPRCLVALSANTMRFVNSINVHLQKLGRFSR